MAADAAEGATLVVHLEYTGSGTIDDSHKIYVVLWDSPDFVKGGGMTPFAEKAVTTKSADARFEDVQTNPVYVSMAYDPTGKWQADSAPPSGSSLGLYSKQPGTPEPVRLTAGKTTSISATLDDSHKVP